MTDGLVGFEREIVETIVRELPASSRLHTVAVGSAPSRALTTPAARAGRGIEVVLGLDEVRGAAAGEPSEALKPGVEAAVARVLAATRAPLLTEVEISGSALIDHAPARLPDVYAGAPLRAAVRLRPDGGGLLVHGKTAEGAWEQYIDAEPVAFGEGNPAVVSLYGREAVEDLEMRLAAGLADAEAEATIERWVSSSRSRRG